MSNEVVDIGEVTQKFRILGVAAGATKEEVRRARNKLLGHFHPDKHSSGWTYDDSLPEKRVYLIQSAYLYIIENFDDIQKAFKFLPESYLSNQLPVRTRSHWVYTVIESYGNTDIEI